MYAPKPVSAGELKSSSRELDKQLAEMKKKNANMELWNRMEADKRIAERILTEFTESEKAEKAKTKAPSKKIVV